MKKTLNRPTKYATHDDVEIMCRCMESVFEDKLDEIKKLIKVNSEEKIEELTPNEPEIYTNQLCSNRQERKMLFEKNRKYFRDHEKEFEGQFPGLYIAINDGKILGTGKHRSQLAGNIYREYGNVPIFVSKPGSKIIETINIPIVN